MKITQMMPVEKMREFLNDKEYDGQECYIEVFPESVAFVVGAIGNNTSMSFGPVQEYNEDENC